MALSLPTPPDRYTPQAERVRNDALEQADAANLKRTGHLDIGNMKYLLRAVDTGEVYELVVSGGILFARPLGSTAGPPP